RLQPAAPGPVAAAPQFVNPVSPVLAPVTQPGKDAWIPPDQLAPPPKIPEMPALPPGGQEAEGGKAAFVPDPLIAELEDSIAKNKAMGNNPALIRQAENSLK